MALEAWALDGVALTSGSFLMLELTADPPKARAEWITAADSEGSDLLRDPLHENREITMKLRVAPQASMNAALDQIGVIRDKLRNAGRSDDGIPLVWTPHDSTRSVTFDVLHGEIPELPIGLEGHAGQWFKARPIFTVVLTCKSYWRGTETLTSTATASTPLTTLEITGVTGDIPALGRLIVTDMATQSRRHVEWGLEGRNYQPVTSLIVDSDNMVVTGTAGSQATATGAYDPNATGNNAITATIGPLPVIVCKTGNLSHVGTFRVRARVWYFTGTYSEVYAGLDWQVAGGELASNPWASVKSGGWRDVDLGIVTIHTAASGTQQWQGMIRAQTGTSGVFGESFVVDYLVLIPVDEGYGRARGVFLGSDGVVSGRDNFTGTTSLALLNARVAPVGGTWATSGSTSGDLRFRDVVVGGGPQTEYLEYYNGGVVDTQPRWAILGATNYTDVTVRVGFTAAQWVADLRFAVIARWTNSTNYVYMEWANTIQSIKQVVAGTTTTLASRVSYLYTLKYWDIMSLTVYASGRVVGELLEADGSPYGARLEASSSALATGGTLATGRPGLSAKNGTDGTSLFFDDFYVITPTNPEPIALYSGRTMEFRHNDTLRQDSTGTYYGRPSSYRGSRFLVPPGTSRVAVKGRRNDADVDIDGTVIDSTRIQVGWTPRGLVVPR